MRQTSALSLPICWRIYMALCALVALSSVAAAQEAPRKKRNLARADRAAWREVLRWPETCEEDYESAYAGEEKYGGVEFHALGRGLYLVEVVCDGGGIQPSAVFVLYDERRPRRARLLKLKGFDESDDAKRPARYSPVRALTKFDARRRELSLMSKYDAMGTCGLFVRYRFVRGRPRVVEAREQVDCGGPEGTPDTDRWPRKRL
ncbi:MAG TPA: hypothetical protein VF064_01370 [Pyrinomonadaceae bacterium]